MPTIIITKDFLDSLFIESDLNENNSDLFDFLHKEIFDFTLICNLSSTEDYAKALIDNPLWEILLDKFKNIVFKINLIEEIEEDGFYKKLDEQNIFLLSINENKCETYSSQRGYIFISSNNISKSWCKIRAIRKNGLYKVTNEASFPNDFRFDCWSKIENFTLPLTSIIIFDKYIFCNKSNQKTSDNLLKMLNYLCFNQELLKPISLTIISEFERDNQITDAFELVDTYLKSHSINNVDLNIIRHNKSQYPADFEGLHYRVIFTNNLKIKCDDSFNFFKPNGKINNDSDINVTFNFNRHQKTFFDKEIKHLKRYVGKINNFPNVDENIDKVYYHKHKNNYLFK